MPSMRTWVVAALCLALLAPPAWSSKKAKSPRKPRASKVHTTEVAPPPPPLRHVFRCGNSYQASPCDHASSQQITVADGRSQAQIKQAQHANALDQKQVKVINKENDKAIREAQTKNRNAIALNCPGWPKQPFEDCSPSTARRPNKNRAIKQKVSKRIKVPSAIDSMSTASIPAD